MSNTKTTATLPAEEYHAAEGISKTQLGYLLKSPAHLKSYLTAPRKEPSKDQIFGTAVHAASLEPDRFATEWVVAPVVDRRTTVGKQIWAEFASANVGKTLIEADERQRVLDIAQSLRDNLIFGGALRTGTPELSLFAEADNGLPIKGRFDLWSAETNVIYDIKTTTGADKFTFPREIRKWAYALQASHYLDLARRCGIADAKTKFVFIAVEKAEAPYATALYEIDAASLIKWDDIRNRLLDQWKKCENIGVYPAYSHASEIIPVEA
jgi:exodeoxyribonuclease VIII